MWAIPPLLGARCYVWSIFSISSSSSSHFRISRYREYIALPSSLFFSFFFFNLKENELMGLLMSYHHLFPSPFGCKSPPSHFFFFFLPNTSHQVGKEKGKCGFAFRKRPRTCLAQKVTFELSILILFQVFFTSRGIFQTWADLISRAFSTWSLRSSF